MSTLKVNTVQHNTSGFNNVVQFTDGAGTQNGALCRAWVNFNGTGTVAIRATFNVSSITDGGTGTYTINFSNAMVDGNYSAVISADGTYNGTICGLGHADADNTGLSSSNLRVEARGGVGSGSVQDPTYFCCSIFR